MRVPASPPERLDLGAIEHVAYYNQTLDRIEIFARFTREAVVTLPGLGRRFRIGPGEMILTEISRKFQVPNMYETLSLFNNVMVSLQGGRRVFATLFRKLSGEEADRIWEILEFIGLADKAQDASDTLSHGERQWLELGMLMAANSKLLLLDEPTTGMTEQDKHKTAELIEKIARNHTVLLVEHDMHIVRLIARKVTVLHQGQVLAEGPLAEVVENETVRQVYLGKGKFA